MSELLDVVRGMRDDVSHLLQAHSSLHNDIQALSRLQDLTQRELEETKRELKTLKAQVRTGDPRMQESGGAA